MHAARRVLAVPQSHAPKIARSRRNPHARDERTRCRGSATSPSTVTIPRLAAETDHTSSGILGPGKFATDRRASAVVVTATGPNNCCRRACGSGRWRGGSAPANRAAGTAARPRKAAAPTGKPSGCTSTRRRRRQTRPSPSRQARLRWVCGRHTPRREPRAEHALGPSTGQRGATAASDTAGRASTPNRTSSSQTDAPGRRGLYPALYGRPRTTRQWDSAMRRRESHVRFS